MNLSAPFGEVRGAREPVVHAVGPSLTTLLTVSLRRATGSNCPRRRVGAPTPAHARAAGALS